LSKEEYDLIIAGGKLIDPGKGSNQVADIYIRGKNISRIETKKLIDLKKFKTTKDEKIIDASGKLVTPGLIDMHTHLREPGREDEETIYTGSQAAVAGGFTSICCMPNTNPPIDDQESVNFVYDRARKALCKVFCVGAATKGLKGQELTEMADLKDAGAIAVTDDGRPISNSRIMRYCLEYSRMLNLPVISHCEDLALSSGGVMHEGYVSTLLGLCGIPSLAEEIMVSRDIALAGFTRGRMHIAHVSTKGSVELIRTAKKKGLNITCEATPHHFTLTDELVKTFNTNARVNPPLRTEKDVEEIKKGLKDGTIDCIATDHAPHSIEEKDVEFNAAPPGMVGLETALGLVITELINKKVLSWEEAIAKMSINPARILDLNLGKIEKDGAADLTIIDPKISWTVDTSTFKSKSKNSPFQGKELTGKAWMTIVDGKIVYRL
jgi:dihydroorotase